MELKGFVNNAVVGFLSENMNKTQSKYFSNIGLNSEDVFDMIDYHNSYRDLYPNFSDENEYEDDYYFTTIFDAYKDVNEILNFFNSLPNPITIYRSILVKSIEDINYDYLGDSWSFDKQSAINFAENEAGGNVLLIGKTNFDNVDWKNTIKLFYEFSRTLDGYEENEINIIDSDEIFDIKIEKI